MKAWQLPIMVVATVSAPVYAVQPQGIQLGSGVVMLPGVEVSIVNDNNIYFSESSETSSRITRIRPNVGLVADLGTTQLNAYFQLENGAYSENSDDNYLDQLFVLGADVEVTGRQAIGFDLSINASHNARGAGSTQGSDIDSVDPDEFKELTLGADYTYGADKAFANITAYLENYDKTYSTNEELTDPLEHSKLKMGALLALRVSDATRALIEIRNTGISYSDDSVAAKEREGSELKLLAGASWDFAGKTTGQVKLGLADRKFDESSVDGDSRFSWEAGVTWTPRSYSVVNFVTAQETTETAGGGSHIAKSTISFQWDHRFSTKFGLKANVASVSEEYVNSSDDRDDSTLLYGVTGVFSPNNMFDIKLGVDKNNRSSSDNAFDYDAQVITLGLVLAI